MTGHLSMTLQMNIIGRSELDDTTPCPINESSILQLQHRELHACDEKCQLLHSKLIPPSIRGTTQPSSFPQRQSYLDYSLAT
jgi:hypothetical protein